MSKVPKIRSLHIFAICPEKHLAMKLIFCVQINTRIFYKLIVSLWVCVARRAQSTQNNKPTMSLQYLKESVKDKVDFFCPQINVKGFFKLILLFWVNVARHVQIAINNKVAISLQYLKKKVSDEVDFLHLDKHESLLQLDTMILMGMVKHS